MITIEDIRLMLEANKGMTQSQIVADLINTDLESKAKREMLDGVRYYDVDNSKIVDEVDFRKYYNENTIEYDWNASNNKILSAHHTIITNQKNSYILGKPLNFNIDEKQDKSLNNITNILGQDFDDMICEWELNSTNKGFECVHPYINRDGKFDYVIIPAEQIIPIYDGRFQKNLEQVIRYYEVEYINAEGDIDIRYNVEWWTSTDVTYYVQEATDKYVLDITMEPNPRGHFFLENKALNMRKNGSWGKVPFIILKNNTKERSDLFLYKTLIDDFDFNTSDFSNSLREIQENLYNIAGYSGTDLTELRRNLKVFRIVLTDMNGSISTITNPIEKDARDAHLNRLEENIYMYGQAINPKLFSRAGNITNVFIQTLYSFLDLKANVKIRKVTKALKELMWFANEFLNQEHFENDIDIVFDKSTILNEMEKAQIVSLSNGIVSQKTNLANHPFVDDVQYELDLLSEEEPNMFEENAESE